jgi:hypothetical protein
MIKQEFVQDSQKNFFHQRKKPNFLTDVEKNFNLSGNILLGLLKFEIGTSFPSENRTISASKKYRCKITN